MEWISWLVDEKKRVKERARSVYERFYPLSDLVPSIASFKTYSFKVREAHAIREIFDVEASSLYAPLIEWYANATRDPISGNFKQDVEHLKRIQREYEGEYEQREKLVITRSKKHIYVSRQKGKIMLSGDTFPVKEELKKKGFKWDPLYKVWYTYDKGVDLSKLKRELEAL